MKELIDSLIGQLEGSDAVLVNVIASSGSAPRSAGAMMLVCRDGSSVGTIGGGAVEFAAQKHAAEVYSDGESEIVGYNLAPNEAADLGMICGGKVTVYFQYIARGDSDILEMFRYLSRAFERAESVWLIRRIQNQQVIDTGVYGAGGLMFAKNMDANEIKPLLKSNAELTDEYFVEPVVMAGKVYVFGAGHVAQQLVPVLARVAFSVVVFDDREKFARRELFPDAVDVIHGDFTRISDKLMIGPSDYVVIMTQGHQKDFEVLEQTLRTDATYVGCIGSRRKVAATKERLKNAGLTERDIDRMISPIGIEIKAETPEEIAISIAAQMIMHRAEKA